MPNADDKLIFSLFVSHEREAFSYESPALERWEDARDWIVGFARMYSPTVSIACDYLGHSREQAQNFIVKLFALSEANNKASAEELASRLMKEMQKGL